MKIFIDSANAKEIKTIYKTGAISGITTNPSLIANEARGLQDIVYEICESTNVPISVEVMSLKSDEMVEEAKLLSQISPNIVIKIPMSYEGLVATNELSKLGIKTNMTLIFSANQALLAARSGATYVSVFLGRLDDTGIDPIYVISEVSEIFKFHNIESKIIAASVRNLYHVIDSAKVGADIATIPYKIIFQMINHPLTAAGIEKFINDTQK